MVLLCGIVSILQQHKCVGIDKKPFFLINKKGLEVVKHSEEPFLFIENGCTINRRLEHHHSELSKKKIGRFSA